MSADLAQIRGGQTSLRDGLGEIRRPGPSVGQGGHNSFRDAVGTAVFANGRGGCPEVLTNESAVV